MYRYASLHKFYWQKDKICISYTWICMPVHTSRSEQSLSPEITSLYQINVKPHDSYRGNCFILKQKSSFFLN